MLLKTVHVAKVIVCGIIFFSTVFYRLFRDPHNMPLHRYIMYCIALVHDNNFKLTTLFIANNGLLMA